MAYTLEEHEAFITDIIGMLNIEGVDQAKLSGIIQGLRTNYSEINTSLTDSNSQIELLKGNETNLKARNMELLTSLGSQYLDSIKKTPKDINDPNKGIENKKPQDEKVFSLEDIANNILGGK